MTRNQIIERVKTLMHVGDRSDLSPSDEALLGDTATAIVDMLGPKELRWTLAEGYAPNHWLAEAGPNTYVIGPKASDDQWEVCVNGDWYGEDGWRKADAEKEAQAHHEEQHWKRTRIGEA